MKKLLFILLFLPLSGICQDSYTSKIISRIVYCLDGTIESKETDDGIDRIISIYKIKLPKNKYTLDSFKERVEYCTEKMAYVRIKEKWGLSASGSTFRAIEAKYRLSDTEFMDIFFDEYYNIVMIHVTHMN